MLKVYQPKKIWCLLLFFSLIIAEGFAYNNRRSEMALPASGFLQDVDLTTTITNQSVANSISDGLSSFSLIAFELKDVGGDGLPSSLAQLVFKVKENGTGISDVEGLRLENVLENIYIRDNTNNIDLTPLAIEFPAYDMLVLTFSENVVMSPEGLSTRLELFAQAKIDAVIADHATFSLEALVNDFQVTASSSSLSSANTNFEGEKIHFDFQANALEFRNEPALVRAVKNVSPTPDGEEFSVDIIAVDANGRKDIDFTDDLVVGLKENGVTGRELFGNDDALYPTITNGEFTSAGLMYLGNSLPEYFQLQAVASKLAAGTGFSSPIYAVAQQDKNATASVVANSGTPDILYTSFQEAVNLDENNSVSLGAFAFEDSPGSANDKLATTITALHFYVSNPVYLRTVALFDGTTRLMEQAIDLQEEGIIQLEGFNFEIGNNQKKSLQLRATFKEEVKDNEKISLRLHGIHTEAIGSQFWYPEGVIPEAENMVVGDNTGDNVNRLEVIAASIHIISLPEKAEKGQAFNLPVEAVDVFGNRDLDVTSTIEISKASGPGNLSPSNLQLPMSAGFIEAGDLVVDKAGLYSITATDINTGFGSTTTNPFKVYASYSYEGLLISEIGQGAVNSVPNYLELYNASATENFGLENLELRVYENGASTPSYRILLNEGASLAPGEVYVISNTAFEDAWGEPFISFKQQQVNTGMVGNGNDVYEVYDLFHNKIVDVYGVRGENGNGKNWNYHQKLVNRRSGVDIGNAGSFDVEEFTIVPYSHPVADPGTSNTTDLISPSLTAVEPTNGSQDVLENSTFTFTFNEAINFENKQLAFIRKDNNETVYSTSLTNATVVSGEGANSLIIQPGQLLPSATVLTVSIEEGALTDLAGNSISIEDYQFKTTDSIDPVVVSLEPADNATNAVLEPVFKIVFSEDVIIGSGLISIYTAEDNSFVSSFPVTSGFVRHSSPNVIEFELLDRLDKLTSYYILTSAGIVKDAAGNLFAGIRTEEEWNFTTIDPYINSPKIITLSPANGEEHVALDQVLRMSFDEAVVAGRGTIELYNASTGAFVTALDVENGAGITISGREVQLSFSGLQLNTIYNVIVNTGTFQDSEGNPIEGISHPNGWVFTTVQDMDPLLVIDSSEDPLYFGNVPATTTSGVKIYRLGGRNLREGVVLQIPEGFVVSADGGNAYQKENLSLTVEQLSGYREILVKFAPEVADGKLYQTILIHTSAGAVEQQIGVLGREGVQPTTISIAEARAKGPGASVQVRGVITDGNSFVDNRRFLQDATAGIAIYRDNNAVLSSLERGTQVLVSGEVIQSSEGLLLIGGSALNIEVEPTAVDLPEPLQLYADRLGEGVESRLIGIRNLKFEDAGERFRLNHTYQITDSRGNSGVLKIEGTPNTLIDTEIPQTGSIHAIVTEINGQHVLLPRDRADLQIMSPSLSTSLPDGKLNFGFVKGGSVSDALRLRIYSRDLAENISVSVAEPFQVSSSSVVNFSQSIQLSSSSNGVDVWIRFAPEEENGNIYQDVITLFSSGASSVTVAVAGVEGEQPASVTIAQARVMRVGQEVQVKGIVSSGNTLSYHERYLQDETAGIVAHKVGDGEFSAIPIGAEIIISGTLEEYNNLLQIGGTLEWEMVNGNAGELDPMLTDFSGIGEQNEAKLLSLQGIRFVEEGNFEAGKVYSFLFSSGEKAWVKIPAGDHPLAGFRLPYQANLTGVLSQSGDGYYVIPRLMSDLEPTDAVIETSFPEGAMNFFFVPAGVTSAPKYFTVNGRNLQGIINLSTSAPFELSTNGTNFGIAASIPRENAEEVKVYVRFKPTLTGGDVSEDYLTLQTANGRTVKVPLKGIEGQRPEVLSIAQARALGAGERVKIQGVLTSGSSFYAGKRFIQDLTAGLVISAVAEKFQNMEAGDKVEVSGDLIDQAGLLQLEGAVDISIIIKGAGIPAAREITTAAMFSEENEAELVAIASARFVDQGYFEQGKSYTILLENGEAVSLRIAGDNHPLSGQIIPAKASLQGVLAQKEDQYEIWPRSLTDLQAMNYGMAIITEAPANGFDLGMVAAGNSSPWEQYTVTGVELDEDITIEVAFPFEISVDMNQWSGGLTIPKDAVKKEVYVRFSPQNATGDTYFGELVHTSGGIRSVIALQAQEGVKSQAEGTDLLENFDLCLDLNTFNHYDMGGSVQWQCLEGRGVENTGAVGIFQDQQTPEKNEDWLISPAVLMTPGSRLSFDIARKQDGPELELLISNDYRGSGNPANANWEKIEVSIPEPGNLSFFARVNSLNLSQYAGQEIYLAFKYTATYDAASAYLIDNFTLLDIPSIGFEESAISILEGETEEITLSLSKPVLVASMVTLSVQEGNHLQYGEQGDYLTSPGKGNTGISLEIAAGEQEVSFDLSALEDWLEEVDEELILTISVPGEELLIKEAVAQLEVTIRSNSFNRMPISTAREVSEQGVLIRLDQKVKLTGLAYGPNLSEDANVPEFRLIDHTAQDFAAILVKMENKESLEYNFREGDRLEVVGVLKETNGLAMIVPEHIRVIESNVTLKQPKGISVLGEGNESDLVELENVEIVRGWQNNPSASFKVTVKDEEGHEYNVHISSKSDLFGIPVPEGKFTIIGFVSQYDETAPHTEGYYLIPRSKADLRLPTGLAGQLVLPEVILYPNPASEELFIRSAESSKIERVEFYSIKGELVISNSYTDGNSLAINGLSSGIYQVRIILKDGSYSIKRISVMK